MLGLPVLSGAVQLTDRLSLLPSTAETVGAAGAEGGSSTSSTVTVMAWSVVSARAPVPPVAVTVTR